MGNFFTSLGSSLAASLELSLLLALSPALVLSNPESVPPFSSENPALNASIQKGNWSEAATLSKDLLTKFPHSPNLVSSLVNSLTHLGNKEQAIALINQEIAETQGETQAFLIQKGRVLGRLFLSNKTFETFQEGMNFFKQKKFKAAREKFEKAILNEPTNSELMTRIGQCLLSEGDSTRAIHYLSSASKLSPYEPEIRLWLGRALSFQNRASKKDAGAISELKIAHQALQESEIPALWLAEAIASTGQLSLAVAQLEEHIKKNPLHVAVLEALARLRLLTPSQSGLPDLRATWNARKDLQLAQSRMGEYTLWRSSAPLMEFAIDPLKPVQELQAEIQKLQGQIDAKL